MKKRRPYRETWIGKRFGKLKIIKFIGFDRYRKPLFETICDCGKVTIKGYNNILKGVFSCGQIECKKPHNREDLKGQKFGRLLVLKYAYTKKYQRFWKCLCECGKTTILPTVHLKAAHTQSCGCLGYESKCQGLMPGESGLHSLFYRFHEQAKKRGFKFQLTLKDVKNFSKQNCYYCGAKPAHLIRHHASQRSVYVYNGIDRKDSAKGYNLKNCVSCCGVCNKMKWNLSEEAFYAHIKKIYKFFSGKTGVI